VIPHHVHHSKSDKPGDPYGPHLGWLGSYLATESQQKMRLDITRAEYDRLTKSLSHIGFMQNSYEDYQRIGSVENMWHFGARMLFVNLFWPAIGYAIAGWFGALSWLSASFVYSLIVRDFNYRGHGGFLGTNKAGIPLNQFFYGVIAGEWHDNHHAYPRLARSGLAWWQLDIPYWIIKLLNLCGAVQKYNSPDGKNLTNASSAAMNLNEAGSVRSSAP
jgi:stearoyl-CoA desaturase (delta-9 desaturase)